MMESKDLSERHPAVCPRGVLRGIHSIDTISIKQVLVVDHQPPPANTTSLGALSLSFRPSYHISYKVCPKYCDGMDHRGKTGTKHTKIPRSRRLSLLWLLSLATAHGSKRRAGVTFTRLVRSVPGWLVHAANSSSGSGVRRQVEARSSQMRGSWVRVDKPLPCIWCV
jgi:hypothetical protein